MSKPITMVLAGAGGYGRTYVRAMMREGAERGVTWAGIVEPYPDSAPELPELRAQGVKLYASLEDFYKENTADLCVISSPIQFHIEQAICALEHGSHVLCEKPLCAVIQDAQRLIAARDKAGKIVDIGFQWSHAEAIEKLKADIMAGKFGAPKRLKTLILWPRDKKYYTRGVGWAGKKMDAQGRYVLDNVVSNATAHYLHNMLYVLGGKFDASLQPETLEACLMRANDIEMYDTAFIRCVTAGGAELVYVGSHAVEELINPKFSYEFEKGTAEFWDEGADSVITATMSDGSVVTYGGPNAPTEFGAKLWRVAAAIRGEAEIPCPVEAAMPHVRCMNAALASMEPVAFPANVVRKTGDAPLTHVDGLETVLKACYQDCRMPTKADAPWVSVGKTVRLADITAYK